MNTSTVNIVTGLVGSYLYSGREYLDTRIIL